MATIHDSKTEILNGKRVLLLTQSPKTEAFKGVLIDNAGGHYEIGYIITLSAGEINISKKGHWLNNEK